MNAVQRFVLDTTERAVKTGAQTAIATFGGGALNIWSLPWHTDTGIVAGAVVLSVLTSLSSITVGSKKSASLVK